jgi:hypothetical protein
MPNLKEKKLPKHHYIPVFYLKQWTNGEGELCEFSRKYKEVKPRRTSPDGTGYVRGLYRLPNLPDEKAEVVESRYMKQVDNYAAPALQWMLTAGLGDLPYLMKVAWARFLHCLVLRSPEYLAAIEAILKLNAPAQVDQCRDSYDSLRGPRDPLTFEDFRAKFLANPLNTSAARIIHQIIDSENVIGHLCEMKWHIVDFNNTNNLLLTSDRPIVMTNGIGNPGAHLAIPVSPKALFVATHDQIALRQLRAMSANELVRASNTRIVEQAVDWVYGFSDASLRFVSKRLGKRLPATPLETGVLHRADLAA